MMIARLLAMMMINHRDHLLAMTRVMMIHPAALPIALKAAERQAHLEPHLALPNPHLIVQRVKLLDYIFILHILLFYIHALFTLSADGVDADYPIRHSFLHDELIDSFNDDHYAEDEDSDGFLWYEDETSCDEYDNSSSQTGEETDQESLDDRHSVTDDRCNDEERDRSEDSEDDLDEEVTAALNETDPSETDGEDSDDVADLTAAVNKFKETDRRRLARIHLLEMRNSRLRAALVRTKDKLNAVIKEKREVGQKLLETIEQVKKDSSDGQKKAVFIMDQVRNILKIIYKSEAI